jgi:copper chaperone CopZ
LGAFEERAEVVRWTGFGRKEGAGVCGVRGHETRTELLIVGMRGNSCRELVAEVLTRVPGVRDVQVSLLRARAVVVREAGCKESELIRAVMEAGFGATLRTSEARSDGAIDGRRGDGA